MIRHLDVVHQLDDKHTAQVRIQMEIVNQLQIQVRDYLPLRHPFCTCAHVFCKGMAGSEIISVLFSQYNAVNNSDAFNKGRFCTEYGSWGLDCPFVQVSQVLLVSMMRIFANISVNSMNCWLF